MDTVSCIMPRSSTNRYVLTTLLFAVHQQYGLLIIDPKTDKIIRTIAAPIEKETVKGLEKEIQRGFGSIVQSKDGTSRGSA